MVIRIPRQFGQCVRTRRQELGWNQDELARMAGVSRSTVYRLEAGTSTSLYPAKLLSVLDALGLQVSVDCKPETDYPDGSTDAYDVDVIAEAVESALKDSKIALEESDEAERFGLVDLLAMGDDYKHYAARLNQDDHGTSQKDEEATRS